MDRIVYRLGHRHRSVPGECLGSIRGSGEECDDVGQFGGFQVVLQPFGHQRPAGSRDFVHIGAEDLFGLAFLALQDDGTGRLGGDQAGEHATVLERGGVTGVAGLDFAVGVEDGREEGVRRGVRQRGEIRADLVADPVEAMTDGETRSNARLPRSASPRMVLTVA